MRYLSRFLGAAAILALSANVAQAQAQKGRPSTMPATSKAHMSKADKDAMKASRSAATAARQADQKAEKSALAGVKDQRKALLKGIKLTKDEKAAVKAVEKRTDDQTKSIESDARTAEKGGNPVADEAQRLNALRDQERTDLRAALSAEHQTRFDANATRMTSKH
jgi:hypothetical protein